MQSTERFSNRVDNYVKYRPTYPASLLEFFRDTFTPKTVADVGSGTGILTELLLESGYKVYAVEPNEKMRTAAEDHLREHDNFSSINGTGENTTLPDHSVDLITVAQAFHWMDPAKTKAEFARILKPGGHIAILWNLRILHSPFSQAYEAIKVKFGTDYETIRKAHEPELTEFFAPAGMNIHLFTHLQHLDLEGLKGQVLSSSYMPNETHPRYADMMAAVEELFSNWQQNGQVTVEYETKVYTNA